MAAEGGLGVKPESFGEDEERELSKLWAYYMEPFVSDHTGAREGLRARENPAKCKKYAGLFEHMKGLKERGKKIEALFTLQSLRVFERRPGTLGGVVPLVLRPFLQAGGRERRGKRQKLRHAHQSATGSEEVVAEVVDLTGEDDEEGIDVDSLPDTPPPAAIKAEAVESQEHVAEMRDHEPAEDAAPPGEEDGGHNDDYSDVHEEKFMELMASVRDNGSTWVERSEARAECFLLHANWSWFMSPREDKEEEEVQDRAAEARDRVKVWMAIGLKPLKVVKRLVRRNPDVLRSRGSWKLVMRACGMHSGLEVLQLLIAEGPDPAAIRRLATKPFNFIHACRFGPVSVVEYLLAHGADAGKESYGFQLTPLTAACRRDDQATALEVVKLLLQHGAKANRRFIQHPVSVARECGYVDVVEELVKHGASTDPAVIANSGPPVAAISFFSF